MTSSNNPLILIVGIAVIAIGIASFWLPKGSWLGLVVPALGICAGLLLWHYTTRK